MQSDYIQSQFSPLIWTKNVAIFTLVKALQAGVFGGLTLLDPIADFPQPWLELRAAWHLTNTGLIYLPGCINAPSPHPSPSPENALAF
jgi:hypothetical protein